MKPHGTPARYNHGRCRCVPCTRAVNRYQKHRLNEQVKGAPLSVPALPTTRRIRALRTIGYTLRHLEAECGIPLKSLDNLSSAGLRGRKFDRRSVLLTTERAVSEAYERLWDKPGGSKRSVSDAAKRGWLPPLAWDDVTITQLKVSLAKPVPSLHDPHVDWVAVDRLCGGERVPATRVEKVEAFRLLSQRGMNYWDAGTLVGLNWDHARRLAADLSNVVC